MKLQDEGKTRHEIKDILGYKHLDSMTKYMKKRGFKVKNNKYILSDDICHQDNNNKINKPVILNNDNSMIFQNNIDIRKDILDIVEIKNDIFNMVNWFKNRDDNSMTEVIEIVNKGIKIDLPESETIRTTIRINKVIWEEFNKFCNKNKEFNKQDLMAQALKDFIKNNLK